MTIAYICYYCRYVFIDVYFQKGICSIYPGIPTAVVLIVNYGTYPCLTRAGESAKKKSLNTWLSDAGGIPGCYITLFNQ